MATKRVDLVNVQTIFTPMTAKFPGSVPESWAERVCTAE